MGLMSKLLGGTTAVTATVVPTYTGWGRPPGAVVPVVVDWNQYGNQGLQGLQGLQNNALQQQNDDALRRQMLMQEYLRTQQSQSTGPPVSTARKLVFVWGEV